MADTERRKVAEHAQRLVTGTAGRACILIFCPCDARLLGRAPAAHCWCRCSRGLRRQTAVLIQGSMRHPCCSVPSIPRQFCSACFWLENSHRPSCHLLFSKTKGDRDWAKA